MLFLFWTVWSYMGHAAFVVTYPEYVEAVAEEPQQYIDFYGNVSFSSAFVAIIIVRVCR